MKYYVQLKVEQSKYSDYKESADRDLYHFNKDLIKDELPEIADKIEEIYVTTEDDWFLGADECTDVPAYLFKLNIDVNDRLHLSEKYELHKLINKTCSSDWSKILYFDK